MNTFNFITKQIFNFQQFGFRKFVIVFNFTILDICLFMEKIIDTFAVKIASSFAAKVSIHIFKHKFTKVFYLNYYRVRLVNAFMEIRFGEIIFKEILLRRGRFQFYHPGVPLFTPQQPSLRFSMVSRRKGQTFSLSSVPVKSYENKIELNPCSRLMHKL